MGSKIKFFVILMFFCLISLNTTSAYSAYINIYIIDLDTNTGQANPILLVDHANSPIQWKLAGTGCTPTSYTNDILAGQYGDGSTISTGSQADLTAGSVCTFYLQVDEIKVGDYYWGGCTTTTTTASYCNNCAGGATTCETGGLSTWNPTPTNSYTYSYHQTTDTEGYTSTCNVISNFGSCSDEIQAQINSAQTTEFNFVFTA